MYWPQVQLYLLETIQIFKYFSFWCYVSTYVGHIDNKFKVMFCAHFSPLLSCLFLSVSVVYFSESINEYAALNWRTFSKQQYFDDNGLFISTVFSIPILLNCMLLIVSINSWYLRVGYWTLETPVPRELGCTIQRNWWPRWRRPS